MSEKFFSAYCAGQCEEAWKFNFKQKQYFYKHFTPTAVLRDILQHEDKTHFSLHKTWSNSICITYKKLDKYYFELYPPFLVSHEINNENCVACGSEGLLIFANKSGVFVANGTKKCTLVIEGTFLQVASGAGHGAFLSCLLYFFYL